ncbi:CmpA/NrtA family ABC transporter substrate-binding protein [Ferrovum sp.]|uniref:CmpA/NrtA family ABC transporter substrate-binding protein n=1 Tax=Ferrovum sp. TaxID=2609467 RepID=UPI0026087D00|nr:CmpA/NrtA family ABC transporter substrate-binding protein [Ferrovum sp.]
MNTWLTGTDKPEIEEVRLGFMPLTDCASLVIASLGQFDRRHGIKICLSRENSWASIRDRLLNGSLDAAQGLYGLVYGVQLGIGGLQRDMAVLMNLNHNGQAITLSRTLADSGITGGESLANAIAHKKQRFTFAQTFPTGTHALWLYYWMAAWGIHPLRDLQTSSVPPPEMVERMSAGQMQGFCAGEPWNALAVERGIGVTVATSQSIWPDHPEKVLTTTAAWAQHHPHSARALIAAVLEASRWLDSSPENRAIAAALMAQPNFLDLPAELISARLQGRYQDGLGHQWQDSHALKFFADGAINYPYLSDGLWFMTQHKRWGMLTEHPDYHAVAQQVQRLDLYREGAEAAAVSVPDHPFRRSCLFDGGVWEGQDPKRYADQFTITAQE